MNPGSPALCGSSSSDDPTHSRPDAPSSEGRAVQKFNGSTVSKQARARGVGTTVIRLVSSARLALTSLKPGLQLVQ
jgi:hypothetical protein